MRSHARVVVIGGGIAGVSVAYHLTRRGWSDVVLLEKSELTSGSTWHAAGNTPNFSTSWTVMRMQAHSTALYRELRDDPEHPITYHVTGSIRLAQSRDRMDEYRWVTGMAGAQGHGFELLSPAEAKDRYPFLETAALQGALWDPNDGDIDPSQVTQALARRARAGGAEIRRFDRVGAIERLPSGEWRVHATNGAVTCEHVVNAAGYHAAEIGAMVGLDLPVVTMQHQYLVTEGIPELQARAGQLLPLLRDPDDSYYLRQERDGLLLGPYEWQATPAWLDGLPHDFANQLWPDDLERLERYIELACGRVPILGSVGVKRVVNGPIPYTPDGLPLLGPAYPARNVWNCAAFSFGIVQGAGAGEIVADWIVDGEPGFDAWAVDGRRFTEYATRSWTVAKAVELYQNEYGTAYPVREWPAGRPAKTTPLYTALKARGAHFGARAGWERPTWFETAATPGVDRWSFRRPGWHDAVAAEVRAVHERVGLLDLPGFTKLEVTGPGAAAFLDRVICGKLPRPGRVGLAYALNPQGGIKSEFTVAQPQAGRFYLCSASSAEWHDRQWLVDLAPADDSVRIENVTGRFGTLVLAGPRARDLLAPLVDVDLSALPWMGGTPVVIGTARGLLLRVSYVGELGYELHLPMESLLGVHDRLRDAGEAHGLADFGIYAVESMRLEKAYRSWKADLVTEVTPFEASLDRFVDLAKGEFVGRDALIARREASIRERLVPLRVDAADADAIPVAQVWQGADRVGLVTSGGYGHRLRASLALAYVRADLARPGTALEVEILGERRPAVVLVEPPFDPENARLRA